VEPHVFIALGELVKAAFGLLDLLPIVVVHRVPADDGIFVIPKVGINLEEILELGWLDPRSVED
jgi:hypothetical protein